ASLAVAPDDYESLCNLATALAELGKLTDAFAPLQRARSLQPEDYRAIGALASLFKDMGNAASASVCYREALRAQPTHPVLASNYLFALNYDATCDGDAIAHEHRRVAESVWGIGGTDSIPSARRGGVINVAYISPDFRDHPVGCLIE